MTEPRAYHHGNLSRVLLDSALALFIERGSFDFTLRELARKAGVTHNAPYRHFAGKAELLAALREEGFALLAERCRAGLAALDSETDPSDAARARVRVLGEAYVRFALEHPHHFRLMLHNPLGGEAGRTSGDAFLILRETLAAAQRAGVVRGDLDARELALGAWSLVHGLASLIVEGNVPSSEARLRRYVRLLDALFFEGALERGTAAARRGRSRG